MRRGSALLLMTYSDSPCSSFHTPTCTACRLQVTNTHTKNAHKLHACNMHPCPTHCIKCGCVHRGPLPRSATCAGIPGTMMHDVHHCKSFLDLRVEASAAEFCPPGLLLTLCNQHYALAASTFTMSKWSDAHFIFRMLLNAIEWSVFDMLLNGAYLTCC